MRVNARPATRWRAQVTGARILRQAQDARGLLKIEIQYFIAIAG
jgi:hypothetical protein